MTYLSNKKQTKTNNMNTYYTVKVKYTKEFQDGTLKRVSEPYLINAMSFTEAEGRAYEQIGEKVRGEFLVTAIAMTEVVDIFFYEDSLIWYLCKVAYILEDADSGKEKRVINNFLVLANTSKQAYDRIEENLKGIMENIEIPSIVKSPLIDIFPYEKEIEKEPKKKSKAVIAEKQQQASA